MIAVLEYVRFVFWLEIAVIICGIVGSMYYGLTLLNPRTCETIKGSFDTNKAPSQVT